MGDDDSNFDPITDALLEGGGRRRRSYRGGANRRNSIAAVLKAQGIAPETAETLAEKIDGVASMKELQTAETQRENTGALVKSAEELQKSLKTVINDQLNNVANKVAAIWEGLMTASGPAATGAVVATGAIGVGAWRSEYVREAMKSVMPLIISDLKAAARENVGAALSVSALLSAALVIFLMLFFNRLMKAMGTPTADLTIKDAEEQGAKAAELAVVPTSGKSADIQAKIEEFQRKAAAALSAEKAGKRPSRWADAPLALGNGGRRRSTSRRYRRASGPKRTRRSSSGRRRGYSRRQRG
jgi:hypothetical protein